MKAWVSRHPLTSFFFIAYAVSWSIAVPLALQAQGALFQRLPWSLHYLTAFGPGRPRGGPREHARDGLGCCRGMALRLGDSR